MSAAQHTPGPWVHDTRGYPNPDVRAASGRKVACTWGVNNQPKTREAQEAQKQVARANARRIVACINACEGISTEVLELLPIGGVPALTAQRDDLLAALQAEQEWRERDAAGAIDPEWDYERMVGDKRRAAIAKATGQEGGASHG